jgi:cytochrome o ubiquinol oxidase subunit 2
MGIKNRFAFLFLSSIAIVLFITLVWFSLDVVILNPKGLVAYKELEIITITTILMLLVVIPVFLLLAYICWKYRSSNKDAVYDPNWDHNIMAETIWWGFPLLIIFILSLITYTSSHELDPFKPLKSDVKPLRIQVVALQWKWLFIYPEEKIASLNFFQIPENRPISFELTADAPMNSFWLPQLGGQIYAMPAMRTELHLIADKPGDYRGSSANISGTGFAGMTFIARASSKEDYEAWVKKVQQSDKSLDGKEYDALVKPSSYVPVSLYVLKEDNLFDSILMKFMMPKNGSAGG